MLIWLFPYSIVLSKRTMDIGNNLANKVRTLRNWGNSANSEGIKPAKLFPNSQGSSQTIIEKCSDRKSNFTHKWVQFNHHRKTNTKYMYYIYIKSKSNVFHLKNGRKNNFRKKRHRWLNSKKQVKHRFYSAEEAIVQFRYQMVSALMR